MSAEQDSQAHVGFIVASVDEGWTPMAKVSVDDVRGWVDLASDGCARRNTAGAVIATAVLSIVLSPNAVTLALRHRVLDLNPDVVLVRLADSGRWAGFAKAQFSSLRFYCLPGDPDAGHPDAVVVADLVALQREFARQIVVAVGPFLELAHADSKLSLAALWGFVADQLVGTALNATGPRTGHREPEHSVFALFTEIAKEVERIVPRARLRPDVFPVAWSQGERLFHTRATCCLKYQVNGGTKRRHGSAKCSTCPLVAADDRHERLRKWLESL
jgi:hypothetical protein